MSNLAPSFVFPAPAPAALSQIANSFSVERYITSAIKIRNSTLGFSNPLQHIDTNSSIREVITAHDIIDVTWTEAPGTKHPVQSVAMYCITCEEDSTQVFGDQRWEVCGNFTEGVYLMASKTVRQSESQSIAFTIPETNRSSYSRYSNRRKEDLLITSVCTFALEYTSYPPSYMTPVTSQIFMVYDRPRLSKLNYIHSIQYRYSGTAPQRITRANDVQNHLPATQVEKDGEKKRELGKKTGIVISVMVAAIAVLYLLRLSGKNQDVDPPEAPASTRLTHITGEETRNRDHVAQQRGSNAPAQHHRGAETTSDPGIPKPPPAYHEAVTDHERTLAQYATQHVNMPVPAYTQRVGPSSAV